MRNVNKTNNKRRDGPIYHNTTEHSVLHQVTSAQCAHTISSLSYTHSQPIPTSSYCHAWFHLECISRQASPVGQLLPIATLTFNTQAITVLLHVCPHPFQYATSGHSTLPFLRYDWLRLRISCRQNDCVPLRWFPLGNWSASFFRLGNRSPVRNCILAAVSLLANHRLKSTSF